MKLYLGLVLTGVMLLAGCGGNDNTGGADGDDVVTIEYWQQHDQQKVEVIDDLIEIFEDENPDIRVNHSSYPYDQFQEQVATNAAADAGPDIINLFYGWAPLYIQEGFLQPLSQEAFPHEEIEDEFFPMVESVKVDDEYWVLPTGVRTLALYMNEELFEEVGLDIESPPEDWDELVEYAQQATVLDDNGYLEIGGLGWQHDSQGHHWFRDGLLRQAGADGVSDDLQTVLWNESPAGLEAFEYWLSFPMEHNTSEPNFYDHDSTAFGQGFLAMNVDGSFRISTYESDYPDLEYQIAPLPSHEEESTPGSFWANGITAGVEGDELEAAEKFLQFLISEEAMEKWIENVGELPAKEEVALQEKYVEDPLYGPFIEQLPIANAHFFVDEIREQEVMINAAEDVLNRGADPEEAFDQMVEELQGILDSYWENE